MKRSLFLGFLLSGVLALSGCGISPEQKTERERALRTAADKFIGAVIGGDWALAYKLSSKRLDGPGPLEKHMRQPWDARNSLFTGTVSSMSWAGDDAAKVKVVWTFLNGPEQSHSAETLLWVWRDGGWKYEGRTLR